MLDFFTLQNLSVKGLCAVIRTNPNPRDRINAAEMLHARLLESWDSLPRHDRRAVAEMIETEPAAR